MAYYGDSEQFSILTPTFGESQKIVNEFGLKNEQMMVQSIQSGSPINMPNSSRLYISTREISGKGENLTKETIQYWG